ncbi:hypothetical protein [Staphylococcus aureus]|nr:hypothetical protein [Staphylococcus aureus]
MTLMIMLKSFLYFCLIFNQIDRFSTKCGGYII